ncbi:beta strand repeat-containing protein [Loktanella agnita]|uniref:beta strand repeat-containing protein n=1 Tax=Loktanella agnita TaxID=287097 RepID=UPI0039864B07
MTPPVHTTNTPFFTRQGARSLAVSQVAMLLGVLSYQPACAQQAIVIQNGEEVTDTVELNNDGDSLTLEQGGALTVSAARGVNSTGNDIAVVNDGAISTTGDDAAGFYSQGNNATNSNSGSITTEGVEADGFYSQGDNTTNSNSGTISTTGGSAVGIRSEGADATNSNSGSITTTGGTAYGFHSHQGTNTTNSNSGSITTTNNFAHGLYSEGDKATNSNSGTISTTGRGADGIRSVGINTTNINSGTITVTTMGIVSFGTNATNSNSGTIITKLGRAYGIHSRESDTTNSNSGTITTEGRDSYGIYSQGDNTTNSNSGTIRTRGQRAHAVALQGNNGSLTNTGVLSATGEDALAVRGGSGAQTVNLGKGSVIIGAIDLGDGSDTVNFDNSAAGASSMLRLMNVETISISGNDRPVFVINDGSAKVIMAIDATGFAALRDASALAADSAHRSIPPQGDQTGAWVSLFGGARNRGDDGPTLAYGHDYAGLMAGYRTDLGAKRMGFVGGMSTGTIATDIDTADIATESAFAGTYLGTSLGAAQITASLLAGIERHDSDRVVINSIAGTEVANATIDGRFVSAGMQVTGGGGLTLGTLQMQPSVSAAYTVVSYDDYTETGTTNANLAVDSRTASTLSARAQLETVARIGGLETGYRLGLNSRVSGGDDVTITLDGVSQSFDVDSDPVLGGFIGARAIYVQNDRLRLTGDVEYGIADGEEDTLSAALNVSVTF